MAARLYQSMRIVRGHVGGKHVCVHVSPSTHMVISTDLSCIHRDLQEEWDEVEDITRTQADQIYASSENQVLSAEVCLCVYYYHHPPLLVCVPPIVNNTTDTYPCVTCTPLQDIERMKSQRRKGEEIVELLAQGSKNYDNKTEFAQKKWLKRKSKKYCPYAIVRRPTASTICEVGFFERIWCWWGGKTKENPLT